MGILSIRRYRYFWPERVELKGVYNSRYEEAWRLYPGGG
jgi:hypothetical protein